LESIY
jgi:pre-mRNA-splicing factor CDC5/CEF1